MDFPEKTEKSNSIFFIKFADTCHLEKGKPIQSSCISSHLLRT